MLLSSQIAVILSIQVEVVISSLLMLLFMLDLIEYGLAPLPLDLFNLLILFSELLFLPMLLFHQDLCLSTEEGSPSQLATSHPPAILQ